MKTRGHKVKTRTRKGRHSVRKTRRQRRRQRKTQRRHKQRGGSFITDTQKIPNEAMYTGYDPDVEGMFTTEVYSDIKKARADDSMDKISPMGV